MKGSVFAVAALVLAPGVVLAGSADDDLAVVKKAVAQSTAPADDRAPARAEGPRTAESRPEKMRWLKVRVTEKAGKRVSINVPLSFARALGEDLPINLGCRRGATHLTIGDILRSLDSGQDLVEVDSDDAKVRVWVE
jgi:hypothetical protein